MPYRRRSRGRYYQRRTAKPTTWIRNYDETDARITADDIWVSDMLAPLHVASPQLRLGGAYENAPSSTGRTCVRILGKIYIRWHRQDASQWQESDGAFIGIRQHGWILPATHAVVDVPDLDQNEVNTNDPSGAANISDWMYWTWCTAFEDVISEETSDIAGTGSDILQVINIDVRSKRRLDEIGDTILFSIRPAGDPEGTQGIDKVAYASSTLLR